MKVRFVSLVMIGFSVLGSGCGKNKGRASGQSAGIASGGAGAPAVPVAELWLEPAPQKVPLAFEGYQVLGAFKSADLPTGFGALDTGTILGTLEAQIESRRYASVYPEKPEPAVSTQAQITSIPVYAFRHPTLPSQWVFAIEANPENSTLFYSSHDQEVGSLVEDRCLTVLHGGYPFFNIGPFRMRCNLRTQECLPEQDVGGTPAPPAKLSDVMERPGSKCLLWESFPTRFEIRQNTERMVAAKIRLNAPLNQQVLALTFRLVQ